MLSARFDRAEALARFGDRYVFSGRSVPGMCVYCGRSASTVDHVPALVAAASASAWLPHVLYPACRSCNSRIGADASDCLLERARRVVGALPDGVLRGFCECLTCQPRVVVPAWLVARRVREAREAREFEREARSYSGVVARPRRGWDDTRYILASSASGWEVSEADLQAFRSRLRSIDRGTE